jgi:hypothetical protein
MNAEASSFDPAIFLDATTTDAFTRRPPLPANSEFVGLIGEPKTRQTKGTKEDNKDEIYTWLDLPVTIDLTAHPAVQSQLNMDQVTLTYGTRLDITSSGSLDGSTGKNTGLRQLRDALGLNVAGQPFNIRMMQGRPLRVRISHRTYQGDIFDQVASVAKA